MSPAYDYQTPCRGAHSVCGEPGDGERKNSAMYEEKVIADNPPSDGREWDCQCARCGSSCVYMACDTCGGEGFTEEPSWDGCGDDELETCDACDGHGGWSICCSSTEWCEGNPIPGREDVKRGQIEWFTFDKPRAKSRRKAPPEKGAQS